MHKWVPRALLAVALPVVLGLVLWGVFGLGFAGWAIFGDQGLFSDAGAEDTCQLVYNGPNQYDEICGAPAGSADGWP